MICMLLPSVNAIVAGEEFTIHHFDRCHSLEVNVSGDLRIDDGEYWLIGCEEVAENSWHCDCSNNYDLRMKTTIRTVNSYDFSIRYTYEGGDNTQTITSTSGSGGWDGFPFGQEKEPEKQDNEDACNASWECTSWSSCSQDGYQTRECDVFELCGQDPPAKLRSCSHNQAVNDTATDVQEEGTGSGTTPSEPAPSQDTTPQQPDPEPEGNLITGDVAAGYMADGDMVVGAILIAMIAALILFLAFRRRANRPDYTIR